MSRKRSEEHIFQQLVALFSAKHLCTLLCLVLISVLLPQNEAVFRFHLTYAIEQASEFYEEKEQQAQEAFLSVSKAVNAVEKVSLHLFLCTYFTFFLMRVKCVLCAR